LIAGSVSNRRDRRARHLRSIHLNDLVLSLTPEDQQTLAEAYRLLEHPGLAARLTNAIGIPIEIGLHLLPVNWYTVLHNTIEQTVGKLLEVAVSSRSLKEQTHPHIGHYRWLGAGSGAAAGFFGLPALAVELPVTTTIMLRAIADIARSEGESLDSLDTRMACLQVFALGGRSVEDDATETGYYGVRLALAMSVANAIEHIAERGLGSEGAPALARLIAAIGSRFSIPLSEKIAAQTVPVVGAALGALINVVFIQHFQDMARGHFIVRRLEMIHGADPVRAAYEKA